MHAPVPDEISGLVLAGGRGARLGGIDKGLVEFRGRPLVETVIERLRPQVGEILVSANRNLDRYRALGLPVLLDAADSPEPFPGPLAGVLAGLRAARNSWLAVVPCDAPFLPADLVDRLGAALGAEHAAVAWQGESIEPMFCLLHADLADDLAAALAHGERRAEAWLRGIGAARADFADASCFANLNTLQDIRQHDDGE
jgi:molybdopterin-guanine dinucleotide biosynthesis protein A